MIIDNPRFVFESLVMDFPLLTAYGRMQLSLDILDRGYICLAWVERVGLGVYFMPPKDCRSYPEDSAILVVCGASHTAVGVSSHKCGEFLEGFGEMLEKCACDCLGPRSIDAILVGISAELCRYIDLLGKDVGPGPVLGYPMFYDELDPDLQPGESIPGEIRNYISKTALVRALSSTEDRAGIPYKVIHFEAADFEAVDYNLRLLPSDFGNICDDFESALSAALKDYRARCADYAARTQIKKANPKRSTRVRDLLWNSYPHICGICGKQIDSFDEMHVDHIIPLSRGGKDILANLQLTHSKCNLKKGAATPECDDEGEETDL